MCMECNGWTRAETLEQQQALIDQFGWSIFGVEGGSGSPPFAYTIGLTGLGRHPELLLSGWEPAEAAHTLNACAAEVSAGRRYRVGSVIASGGCRHRLQFIGVSDPTQLVLAQEIYAGHPEPVTALQIVCSDDVGRFPQDPRYHGVRQQLFGRPALLPSGASRAWRRRPGRAPARRRH